MATHFSARYLIGALAAAVAAALVAGCSGSQGSMPAVGGQSIVPPQIKNHCPGHGGVRANPCSVDFTPSSYGPVTVTIRLPKDKKGTLTESDNCGGASGIASVTVNPSDPTQYVVAAGAVTGYCTATFDYNSKRGKLLGYANVDITNSI
jgi:hypothetical protein